MLLKNNKNIYEWSIGKSVKEVENQIDLLVVSIKMAKDNISIMGKKRYKEIKKANEEAIKFLIMDKTMKSLFSKVA